jgi:hypothetical protein
VGIVVGLLVRFVPFYFISLDAKIGNLNEKMHILLIKNLFYVFFL